MEGEALTTSHVSGTTPSLLPSPPLCLSNTPFGGGSPVGRLGWEVCSLCSRHLVRGAAAPPPKGKVEAFSFCFYTRSASFHKDFFPLILFHSFIFSSSSTKILRVRSESSLPEQVGFRPESTPWASCPSDVLILRTTAHSLSAENENRPGRESQ